MMAKWSLSLIVLMLATIHAAQIAASNQQNLAAAREPSIFVRFDDILSRSVGKEPVKKVFKREIFDDDFTIDDESNLQNASSEASPLPVNDDLKPTEDAVSDGDPTENVSSAEDLAAEDKEVSTSNELDDEKTSHERQEKSNPEQLIAASGEETEKVDTVPTELKTEVSAVGESDEEPSDDISAELMAVDILPLNGVANDNVLGKLMADEESSGDGDMDSENEDINWSHKNNPMSSENSDYETGETSSSGISSYEDYDQSTVSNETEETTAIDISIDEGSEETTEPPDETPIPNPPPKEEDSTAKDFQVDELIKVTNEAPSAAGSSAAGSSAEGSSAEGSSAEGSSAEGSSAAGSSAEGSSAAGSSAAGSSAEGSSAAGSSAAGSSAAGSSAAGSSAAGSSAAVDSEGSGEGIGVEEKAGHVDSEASEENESATEKIEAPRIPAGRNFEPSEAIDTTEPPSQTEAVPQEADDTNKTLLMKGALPTANEGNKESINEMGVKIEDETLTPTNETPSSSSGSFIVLGAIMVTIVVLLAYTVIKSRRQKKARRTGNITKPAEEDPGREMKEVDKLLAPRTNGFSSPNGGPKDDEKLPLNSFKGDFDEAHAIKNGYLPENGVGGLTDVIVENVPRLNGNVPNEHQSEDDQDSWVQGSGKALESTKIKMYIDEDSIPKTPIVIVNRGPTPN